MQTYQMFIEDSRYSVRTLRLVTVHGDDRARELAQKALDEDLNHIGIEVYFRSVRLFGFESLAADPADGLLPKTWYLTCYRLPRPGGYCVDRLPQEIASARFSGDKVASNDG